MLRYINLGEIEPRLNGGFWEYTRVTEFSYPVLFIYTISKPQLGLTNILPLNQQIKIEELPPELEIRRFYVPIQSPSNALTQKGALTFMLSLPNASREEIGRAVIAGLIRALGKYGIEAEFRGGNDLFFNVNGKTKKFCGVVIQQVGEILKVAAAISFDFDAELAQQIYDLTTAKFVKKGEIEHIGDIVGGLHEIAPELNAGNVTPDVAQEIADRLDLELNGDHLTTKEWDKINALASFLDNDEWIKNARRTDIE